mgnify:CR=1 FL=1
MNSEIKKYLETGKHLPVFLRDFHDQKDLFKFMHHLYKDNLKAEEKPNWVQGQIYTIDWFLWFIASHGYTLQKSRKKIRFYKIPNHSEINDILYSKNILKNKEQKQNG